MSPSDPPTASPAKATRGTKRGRATKDSNETPQRARKRALDREAQRTFREKTKNYIAHLEQTVEACKARSDSQLVDQLFAENARLYSTVERLRKIISDVYSATQPETFERHLPIGEPTSSAKDGDPRDDPEGEQGVLIANGISERVTSVTAGAEQELDITMGQSMTANTVTATATTTASAPVVGHQSPVKEPFCDYLLLPAGIPFSHRSQATSASSPDFDPSIHDYLATTTELDEVMNDSVSVDPVRHLGERAIVLKGSSHVNPALEVETMQCTEQFDVSPVLGPSLGLSLSNSFFSFGAMPFLPGSTIEFDMWDQTNDIYGRIFAITPREASDARSMDSGVLFKAVKYGWDSLTLGELSNPVIHILRGYDELIASRLDPLNRLAIAYKNQYLIKYFLNGDSDDLERMPRWQRPSPAQRARKHPLLVDFFAWPGLRDKLIKGQVQVESARFAAAYMRNFRFQWPFSLEDTYQYHPASGTYVATPLFERYHRDLKFWTMDEEFFWDFPEFKEDISSPDSWDSESTPTASTAYASSWYATAV